MGRFIAFSVLAGFLVSAGAAAAGDPWGDIQYQSGDYYHDDYYKYRDRYIDRRYGMNDYYGGGFATRDLYKKNQRYRFEEPGYWNDRRWPRKVPRYYSYRDRYSRYDLGYSSDNLYAPWNRNCWDPYSRYRRRRNYDRWGNWYQDPYYYSSWNIYSNDALAWGRSSGAGFNFGYYSDDFGMNFGMRSYTYPQIYNPRRYYDPYVFPSYDYYGYRSGRRGLNSLSLGLSIGL